MTALVSYSWPGNVRELENLIERLVVTVQRSVIEPQDLPPELPGWWYIDAQRHPRGGR
jgi:DNA-binding NtrC family response regulator